MLLLLLLLLLLLSLTLLAVGAFCVVRRVLFFFPHTLLFNDALPINSVFVCGWVGWWSSRYPFRLMFQMGMHLARITCVAYCAARHRLVLGDADGVLSMSDTMSGAEGPCLAYEVFSLPVSDASKHAAIDEEEDHDDDGLDLPVTPATRPIPVTAITLGPYLPPGSTTDGSSPHDAAWVGLASGRVLWFDVRTGAALGHADLADSPPSVGANGAASAVTMVAAMTCEGVPWPLGLPAPAPITPTTVVPALAAPAPVTVAIAEPGAPPLVPEVPLSVAASAPVASAPAAASATTMAPKANPSLMSARPSQVILGVATVGSRVVVFNTNARTAVMPAPTTATPTTTATSTTDKQRPCAASRDQPARVVAVATLPREAAILHAGLMGLELEAAAAGAPPVMGYRIGNQHYKRFAACFVSVIFLCVCV